MPDIRIRLGRRILTRAEYLREQAPENMSTTKEIRRECYHPEIHHCHTKHVMQPKQPTGVCQTRIIKRRFTMGDLRKVLLTYLLNQSEFKTVTEIHKDIQATTKVSRSGVSNELANIQRVLEPQDVLHVTMKPTGKRGTPAPAYKFTAALQPSDIPGLVARYVQEVTEATQRARAERTKTTSDNIMEPWTKIATNVGKTAEQTVRVKLLLDVQMTFSIKVKED